MSRHLQSNATHVTASSLPTWFGDRHSSSNNNLTSQVLGGDSFITGVRIRSGDTVAFFGFCTNLLLISHKSNFLVQSLDSTQLCSGVHLPSTDERTRQVLKNDCPASRAVQFWTKIKFYFFFFSENSNLISIFW